MRPLTLCITFLLALGVPLCPAGDGGTMTDTPGATFAHIYFMQGDPQRIRQAAPDHARYWQRLDLPGYQGGPFADFSGGMIVFEARDEARARQIVAGDPFVVNGVIGQAWLKAWQKQQ